MLTCVSPIARSDPADIDCVTVGLGSQLSVTSVMAGITPIDTEIILLLYELLYLDMYH